MVRPTVLAFLLFVLPLPVFALQTDELLALVAMPLAVAAVADVSGVPVNDLMDVVAMLNQADVPPARFIEVVRYIPVALVVKTDEPTFVQFVRQRRDEGIAGPALVTVIEERIRIIAPDVVFVTTPRLVEIDNDFVPLIVRTRLANPIVVIPPAQVIVPVRQREQRVEIERKGDDDRQKVRVRVEDRSGKQKVKTKVKGDDDDGRRGDDDDDGERRGDSGKGKSKGKGKGKGKD